MYVNGIYNYQLNSHAHGVGQVHTGITDMHPLCNSILHNWVTNLLQWMAHGRSANSLGQTIVTLWEHCEGREKYTTL